MNQTQSSRSSQAAHTKCQAEDIFGGRRGFGIMWALDRKLGGGYGETDQSETWTCPRSHSKCEVAEGLGTQALSAMCLLAPCSQLWGSCICAVFQGHVVPDASAMLSCSMSGSGPLLPSIKIFLKRRRKKEIQALFLTAAGAS